MSFESRYENPDQNLIHAKLISLSNKIATLHEVEDIHIKRNTLLFRDMDIGPYALDERHKQEDDIEHALHSFTAIIDTVFGDVAKNIVITHDIPNWFTITYNFSIKHKRSIPNFRTQMKVKKR